MMFKHNIIFYSKIFLIFLFVYSCTPMNKIYLNESTNKWDISKMPPKHQLEIGDILFKVISRNEESKDLFNLENNLIVLIYAYFCQPLF